MKIVPVIKSGDLDSSVRFYTEVLDFERKWPRYEDREKANGVAHLIRDGAELLLSRHAGDGVFGSVNRVFVTEVQAFTDVNISWLKKTLVAAKVASPKEVEKRARAIYSGIVGAQLMARSRADIALYDSLIESYRTAGLLPS